MSAESYRADDLVAFDYDGTIAPDGGGMIPPAATIYEGVEALWNAGIATTVITTRPYQRLAGACGGTAGVNRLVSPNYPLATERGARLVNARRDGNDRYEALSEYELDAIAEIENVEAIDFMGFYPKGLHEVSYIWGGREDRQEELSERFGGESLVLPSDRASLRQALGTAEPCLVKVRFNAALPDRDVLQGGLNVAWNRRIAEIVAESVDKQFALESLCAVMGTRLESVRYAGNDDNDIPILKIPSLRERILVGDKRVEGIAEPYNRIESPEALGKYFLEIAGVEVVER